MKNKIVKIIIAIVFLSGLSLLMYPLISSKWNAYRQSQLMSDYEQVVSDDDEQADYPEEWKKARAYNEALYPYEVPDSFLKAELAKEKDPAYWDALNMTGDGMMGIVEIPKIDVKLPIYHSVDDTYLENGVGHIEGSSLPIGGANTHSVISAHRGLPTSELFSNLDELEVGDLFFINILNSTLCYEVDQILTVEPSHVEALAVEEGKDYLTLMTCTPYGVNSHRLLVRGHRTENPSQSGIEVMDTPEGIQETEDAVDYVFWVFAGVAFTGVLGTIFYLREKKLRKKMSKNREKVTDNERLKE